MGIEGQIRITMSLAARRVAKVAIASSRPVFASKVFLGKSVPQALKTLPMLFTVCATAQALAAARACEQAMGYQPPAGVQRIRDCLVRMETIREHLWRILLDWPAFLGEAPERGGMAATLVLQTDYRRILTGGGDPFLQPEELGVPARDMQLALIESLQSALAQAVFHVPPAVWLEMESRAELNEWMADGATIAARLLRRVAGDGNSGAGQCHIRALPFLDADRLAPLLEQDDFFARPHWFGECCESSCTTRVDSALLRDLRRHYGNGLLVRLTARLTEIAQLSLRLLANDGAEEPAQARLRANPGVGQVAAARGQLLHRVQLEGERITGYRILAPTEWNFHPQGVVAASLATLCGEEAEIKRQAELLINAIDPCVGYDLDFS